MTLIEIKEMKEQIIGNDTALKFAWDICGDGPIERLKKMIIKNKKKGLYEISHCFILNALLDLGIKIKEITLPIQKVETSYLERHGFIKCSGNKEKELLLKELLPAIKEKYKSLEMAVDVIANGFLDGLFSMLDKLSADFYDISNLINAKGVIIIESAKYVGDSHYNGEAVISIQSNKGRFIYKPRSLNCELFFNDFSNSFGGLGYRVINKEGYGWVEFVQDGTDNSSEICDSVFFNAGKLQAIAYILMLKDLHRNNISITRKGYYVLDSECLYSTPIDFINFGFYEYNNILDYLIVPRSTNSDMLSIRMVSALGEFFDDNNIALDEIKLVINKFMDGFIEVYLDFLNDKIKMIDYINKSLDVVKTRIVIRSTGYYKEVLKMLNNPRVMMLGSDERCKFLLEKIHVNDIPKDIINSEVKSLAKYDIPYFYHDHVSGGITDLFGDSFNLPGCNMKREIIIDFMEKTIGEHDMNKQIELLRIFLDVEIQNFLSNGKGFYYDK